MTVVIGVDYGSEILVLADTRVSFGKESGILPKDQLIKLVGVDFFQRQAVLGFSGNILFAKRVIESLRRSAKYRRSSGDLKEDFRRWIEGAIKMKRKRHHLQFMLCDFDSAVEAHIYVYDVKESGEVQLQPQGTIDIIGPDGHPRRGKVAVIGSGSELKQRIYETTLRPFGDPKRYDDYEAYSRVRMLMVEALIASEFQGVNSQDVGGPFAIIRLRPNAFIGPIFTWPVGSGDTSDVQFVEEGRRTILSKPSTGEKYVLYPILNYASADFSRDPDASASLVAQSMVGGAVAHSATNSEPDAGICGGGARQPAFLPRRRRIRGVRFRGRTLMRKNSLKAWLKRNCFVIVALVVLSALAVGSFLLGRSGLAAEFVGSVVSVFIIDQLLKVQQKWNARDLRDSVLKRLYALGKETIRVPTYVIPRPVPPRPDVDNPIDHSEYCELLELIEQHRISEATKILPHLFLTPYSLRHPGTYARLETAVSQLLSGWTALLQFARAGLEPHELAKSMQIIDYLESLFVSCQKFEFLTHPDDQGQTVELLLRLYEEVLGLLQDIPS